MYFFILASCILKSTYFTHQQMHYLLSWLKGLNVVDRVAQSV